MPTASDGLSSSGGRIPVSKIRELANASMDLEGLVPLWFGEPDVPTPEFVVEPAQQAMAAGKTTYTEGLGKPWLREAIARYMSGLYGKNVDTDRVAITVSGTNAVNLAFQLLLEPGDRMVTTTPSFPTLMTVPSLQMAEIETVPLEPSPNGWTLDPERLLDAANNAKILLLNSPNNPTGWMLSREDMQTILNHCRKSGTWIISDEVYARIVFDEAAAPSFAEIAEPEDRVLIINSFSKTWAMTGWRLGWLTLPPSLLPQCEKLMEFSMSCAPEFVQAGGLAAIEQGEDFITEQMGRYRKARDVSLRVLGSNERISCIPPHAAFYAFFRIEGVTDNFGFANELVRETRIGIAPGTAFDSAMTDWFRICFAKDAALLEDALGKLNEFLETRS